MAYINHDLIESDVFLIPIARLELHDIEEYFSSKRRLRKIFNLRAKHTMSEKFLILSCQKNVCAKRITADAFVVQSRTVTNCIFRFVTSHERFCIPNDVNFLYF